MSGVDLEDVESSTSLRVSIVATLIILAMFLGALGMMKAFAADYDEWSASPVAPVSSGVYLTGDSIAYWSAPIIHESRPGWHIEGVPGRQVQQLSLQINQILAADPTPRAIVVELGTNTAGREGETPEAYYLQLYSEAIAPIPSATKIVLVTPYRDRIKFARTSDYADNLKAYHQYWEARAMNTLALRDGVCVAPWRALARNNPELLHDGIHPTMEGRRQLRDILIYAVQNCDV